MAATTGTSVGLRMRQRRSRAAAGAACEVKMLIFRYMCASFYDGGNTQQTLAWTYVFSSSSFAMIALFGSSNKPKDDDDLRRRLAYYSRMMQTTPPNTELESRVVVKFKHTFILYF